MFTAKATPADDKIELDIVPLRNSYGLIGVDFLHATNADFRLLVVQWAKWEKYAEVN